MLSDEVTIRDFIRVAGEQIDQRVRAAVRGDACGTACLGRDGRPTLGILYLPGPVLTTVVNFLMQHGYGPPAVDNRGPLAQSTPENN